MNYTETLDYLYYQLPMYQRSGPKVIRKMDLDNITALMEALGDPQKNFSSILIAGTNGKGSTSHILSAILQSAGYRVGLYTSPHYKDFRERVRVDGKPIPKFFVTDFVDRIRVLDVAVEPSFFEISVAMAFCYFEEVDVDVAVVEVGLGGRLDSTNILRQQLSVITNIGWDHMQFLGDTLPQIAAEKAGIITHTHPVLIGERQPELEGVFRAQAEQVGANITYADELVEISRERIENDLNICTVKIHGNSPQFKVESDLLARYQHLNCRTAIAAVHLLDDLGYHIDKEHIQSGLRNVRSITGFQGRFQVLRRAPLIIADSAHNPDGMKRFLEELIHLSYQHLHIVLGMVGDKDVSKVLELLPPNARYYFCKADVPRGMDVTQLSALSKKFQLNGKVYTTVGRALGAAKRRAHPDDLICIVGSVYTVAEVI